MKGVWGPNYCAINFDDFSYRIQYVQITSKGEFVNKTCQTYFKQDDHIVSTGNLWLR